MKKTIILLCMAVVLASAAAAQLKDGQTAYVTAKSLSLKSGTGFFARSVGTMNYGDAVTVLRVNGKWAEVRYGQTLSGWVVQTNLTTKRITGGTGSASSREVAMAGKGFTEEVENVYRETNNADFDAVDAVEAVKISDDDLLNFVTEGRLSLGDE